MKLFETPEIEVLKFNVEDVITTSGGDDDLGNLGGNETPPQERP